MSDLNPEEEKPQVRPLIFLSDEPTESWEGDGLGMQSYAEVIAGAALGTDGPFTIGVFGKWGEGKSSVLRQALSLIETEESRNRPICVWFNAWQYDHETYPIVPLALTIAERVDSEIPEAQKREKANRWITLREIGTALRALASGLTIKAPFLDVNVGSVLSEVDRLPGTNEREAPRVGVYQKAFSLLRKVSISAADVPEKPKIVVFIDDLDRCMPQHALRLLQAIRLVLSQPGFVFVLALDRDPIVRYLTREYRRLRMAHPEDSARSYLDKMVQLPLWLPPHEARFAAFIGRVAGREELKSSPEVQVAMAELGDLLVTGTQANPRAAIRLINSLIADQSLWGGRGAEPSAEWLGFCAISRILRDRLGDEEYGRLLTADQFCARLSRGEEMGAVLDGELRRYEDKASSRLSRVERAERSILARIVGSPVVEALLSTGIGRRWLAAHETRHEIEDYLAPEEDRASERTVDGRKAIEEAIRWELNLRKDEQVTADQRKNITELDLSLSPLLDTDLPRLSELPHLSKIELVDTKVTDAGLGHLAELKALTAVDLAHTRVTDAGLVYLAKLTRLVTLNLAETQVTDTGLAHLGKLASLKELVLASTSVTDAGLSHLTGLEELTDLDLGETEVTDAGLVHLTKLTKLAVLGLALTRVTDAGLVHLGHFASLAELDLALTHVSDAGLPHLTALKGLTDLDLTKTEVTDAGLTHLGELEKLRVLGLALTGVTDAGLSHLENLVSLTELDLSGTKVTDEGLLHLARFEGLTDLDLMDTEVTDAGVGHLAQLTSLRRLILDGTRVTDSGLLKLSTLPLLTEVWVSNTAVTIKAAKELKSKYPRLAVLR